MSAGALVSLSSSFRALFLFCMFQNLKKADFSVCDFGCCSLRETTSAQYLLYEQRPARVGQQGALRCCPGDGHHNACAASALAQRTARMPILRVSCDSSEPGSDYNSFRQQCQHRSRRYGSPVIWLLLVVLIRRHRSMVVHRPSDRFSRPRCLHAAIALADFPHDQRQQRL